MRTIIAGSRGFTNIKDVRDAVIKSGFLITMVLSGTAKGVDRLGEQWAAENFILVEKHPAHWNLYGNAAGPIRNTEMAEAAEALVAVWDGRSRGTQHMIAVARKKGLKVYVHEPRKRHKTPLETPQDALDPISAILTPGNSQDASAAPETGKKE